VFLDISWIKERLPNAAEDESDIPVSHAFPWESASRI